MKTRCMHFIMNMKLKRFFKICAVSAVLFSCFLLIFYQNELSACESHDVSKLPKIIWWTPFTLRDNLEVLKCGDIRCAISDNRRFQNDSSAFLFYGSSIKNWDLPSPKEPNHIWALFHEESPKNSALLLEDRAIELFNITSTFSRYSDVPLTLQHLKNLDDLTSLKYYISTQEKDEFRENGLSPVLYIQSDCETPSNRDSYVRELMKFIKVDSYGQCLNNIKFPQELRRNDHLEDLYESNLMKLVAKYKFTLSFENAICDDYVTEKIWRPLMVGSVPVYLGSNNIRDWLPDGENSAVLVDNFKSPHDLAEYLMILDQNSRKYERHLQHKLSDTYPITNDNLKRAINNGWAGETDSLVRKLECKVCEAIISGAKKVNVERTSEADIADTRKYLYSCPRPVSPITRKTNGSNWWTQHWDEAPCHFKLVKDILDKKINLTEKEYNENVFKLYKDKLC